MASIPPVRVPFVNLTGQHQPLQAKFEETFRDLLLRGDFILGQALTNFETTFAQVSGAEYGVGVASGTDAITLGLMACGVEEGDEVIVPANTFIATVIGVLQAGAVPVLVDCQPNTALIDLEAAQKAVTQKTKAIIPVHLYGQMVSPQQLLDFARTNQLLIFEDAAQAHLAQREGYTAGSVGKAAAFSFYPSKNLGAFGDGGMVITKDEAVAQKLRTLRNYGAARKYYHNEPGKNSRLDNLQAAMLQIKLPYLQEWNQARNQAAQQYDHYIKQLQLPGITPIENHSGSGHIYHLYVIKVQQACPLKREQLQKHLSSLGIQSGIHYPVPCHLQPAYADLGYKVGDFPQAEMLAAQILSLPMYPGLEETQVREVAEAMQTALLAREGEKI